MFAQNKPEFIMTKKKLLRIWQRQTDIWLVAWSDGYLSGWMDEWLDERID